MHPLGFPGAWHTRQSTVKTEAARSLASPAYFSQRCLRPTALCGGMAATALVLDTAEGVITLQLRPDAAPETVKYILKCVASKLYDGKEFYRSDFVIQFGLHGSGVECPHGNLHVNETELGPRLSNTRGTCSIAHWDVPDCGNTEAFINLKENAHLDSAYGGCECTQRSATVSSTASDGARCCRQTACLRR